LDTWRFRSAMSDAVDPVPTELRALSLDS